MSADNYSGANELALKKNILEEFNKGVEKIKSTILSHGFSQNVADNLQLTLREFTLRIGEDEMGAFHYFADGKPFYEMLISTPGSLMEAGEAADQAASSASSAWTDRQQGLMLSLEIAFNLVSAVGQAIEDKYGIDRKLVHGGINGTFDEIGYNTTFRCNPALYLDCLNDLIGRRLAMLVKKPAAQP